jgi:RNA polymerase sigma-70 factor (ECF subfamily)
MQVEAAQIIGRDYPDAPLTAVERDQFEKLTARTYRKVFGMAYRLSGNWTDAEDITQDAFYRAYRSFRDYKADKPFENWVLKITSRLFLDLLRTKRRRLPTIPYEAMTIEASEGLSFEATDPRPNPEEMMIKNLLGEDLQRAVSNLKPDQVLLLEMADLQDVPYKEMARTLGRPIGSIRSKLHRTRRQLQDSLEMTDEFKERPNDKAPEQGSLRHIHAASDLSRGVGSPRRAHSIRAAQTVAVVSFGETK